MQTIDIKTYFKDLQELGNRLEYNNRFKHLVDFCNAFANKERLKIVMILKNNDHCVCELEAILDKSQPSISHHLRILESTGLIRSFKKGKFTHYELVNEKLMEFIRLFSEVFELGLLKESFSILKV
ncbi:MAG: ArsR/SmtB family transcription factor [Candidatus Odinarchaeota archaeon]